MGWAGGSQVMHTICGAEQHVAYLRYMQQINHFPILPGYAGIKPVQRVEEMDRAPETEQQVSQRYDEQPQLDKLVLPLLATVNLTSKALMHMVSQVRELSFFLLPCISGA